jgi:hypothetical protein
MTTLIPQFDLKNGGSTPTGAVNRPINQKLSDVISVKDFGAVGDGSTNDQAAIQNAITYAQSITNGSIYFPEGNYYITSGITFSSNIGIDCASGAVITTSDNTFPAVTLAPTNYGNAILNIPVIQGGSIGLYLKGTSLCQVNISSIDNCVEGIVLEVNNTNKVCADNVINFTVINGCSASGVKFSYNATTTSGTLMQGNQIKGNFITGVKYGIQFYDVNNGGLGSLPWDDTEIDVFAVDCNITGSIGIYGNPSLPPGRTQFIHKGFFGGTDTALIKGAGNSLVFNLALSQAAPYAQMQLTGGPHNIYNSGYPWQGFTGVTTPIALTTAGNTLSTFNSGNPVGGNRFWASITIPSGGLAAGATSVFYFYHPLMTQYGCRVEVEPWWNEPMVVMYAVENSTPGVGGAGGTTAYPFQGVIKVQALSTVAAGTYPLFITVHGIPS